MSMRAEAMLCICQTETVIGWDAGQAAQQFASAHALLVQDAIVPDLLARLSRAADHAQFVSDPVPQLGHRWIEQPAMVGAAIETAINRPVLLRWLAAVTGLAEVGLAEGRLVQTRPGGVDQLTWHDDRMQRAQLGITVHVRDCAYAGGAFELRRKGEEACRFRHADARAGDMVLFDVSDVCEHRVMPVTAGDARLVYTGWFMVPEPA